MTPRSVNPKVRPASPPFSPFPNSEIPVPISRGRSLFRSSQASPLDHGLPPSEGVYFFSFDPPTDLDTFPLNLKDNVLFHLCHPPPFPHFFGPDFDSVFFTTLSPQYDNRAPELTPGPIPGWPCLFPPRISQPSRQPPSRSFLTHSFVFLYKIGFLNPPRRSPMLVVVGLSPPNRPPTQLPNTSRLSENSVRVALPTVKALVSFSMPRLGPLSLRYFFAFFRSSLFGVVDGAYWSPCWPDDFFMSLFPPETRCLPPNLFLFQIVVRWSLPTALVSSWTVFLLFFVF